MTIRRWILATATLAALAGCKEKDGAPAPAAHTEPGGGHAAGGEHAHKAPHGGVVASVATGHVEVVVGRGGKIVLYVLDAELKPLKATATDLVVRVGGSAVSMTLADAAEARYEGKADAIEGEHPVAVVSGTIDGKGISARLELHRESKGHHEGGHAAPGADAFAMELRFDPKEPQAGQPVTLHFTPKSRDGKTAALDIVHEKPLHLLMVSKGLAWFAHEHPEPAPDGSLSLSFTFPSGGEHWIYSDFTPTGGSNIVDRQILQVGGTPAVEPALEPTPMTVPAGAYGVMYHGPDALRAGEKATLAFHVMHEGKDVTDLEPYLGAMGHLVGIEAGGGSFVHAHPEGHGAGGGHHGHHAAQGSSKGPMVSFDAHFAKPGTYKLWPQFMHRGQVVIAPMVVQVGP